jgi:hypothetical protein
MAWVVLTAAPEIAGTEGSRAARNDEASLLRGPESKPGIHRSVAAPDAATDLFA